MNKLIVSIVTIVIIAASVHLFFPNVENKIPFLGKAEKKVAQQAQEFLQIEGQTFDPRDSSIIQMLIAKKKAKFDKRNWHQEAGSADSNMRGIRIMPDGNTSASWKEAIDFVQLSDKKFDTVTTFAKLHKEDILSQHPNAVWRTIKQDSSGIAYDWTVVGDSKLGDFSVVGKVMLNDSGIFHTYYMNKHTANFAQTRQTFLLFLDNL